MAWHFYRCPDCEWYVTTHSPEQNAVLWAEHFKAVHAEAGEGR